MFEKKVIGALRSPALLTDLKSYQRHLASQSKKRGWIIILFIGLLLLQYLPFLLPATQPALSDPASTLTSGVASKQEALINYDNNTAHFKQLAQALGITRQAIASLKPTSHFHPTNTGASVEWAKIPTYRPSTVFDAKHSAPVFTLQPSKQSFFYGYNSKPLEKIAKKRNLLVGTSKKTGVFAVDSTSGNIITSWNTAQNASICYKNPDESASYLHCPNGENVITSTTVTNLTHRRNAQYTKSRAGDQLRYNLVIQNKNLHPIYVQPALYVGDIQQYAQIQKPAQAELNPESQQLEWQKTSIPPNASKHYTFSLAIDSPLALTAQSTFNQNSYNCQLDSFFGNKTSIELLCPGPKVIEHFLRTPFSFLQATATWLLLIVSLFLYARSRLLCKEVAIVIKNLKRYT